MNRPYKYLVLWIIIPLIIIIFSNLFHQNQKTEPEKEISYTEFLDMVDSETISEVVIQGQVLSVLAVHGRRFKVFTPQDSDLIAILKQKGVSIQAKPPAERIWYMSFLLSWFPMILLIGVWIFFMRKMQAGGGNPLSFGKSRARLRADTSVKVTFDDVAGIDEVKEELREIIDFLKDPKKYTRLGGRIPKGVLLLGPGKKNAPCIIFIDEIDAVGRHRGAGLGGGHDEREQTLNQLLVEMDGFESNEGVILISATNRPDVLDSALLRPGRFDRQVEISLPDIRGREEILKVHMKKTPIAADVDVSTLSKGTPGFSGADLENLVNEAALLAAKRNKEKVEMEDFEEAKDKVVMGLARKSKVISEEDKKTTAYHEGGHALVARFLPGTDAVNKITIIPRGRSIGITWFLPEENEFKYKIQLESRLSVAFGGRVAEEIVFGRISTGAADDISRATELARKMVCAWGMSEVLGPLSYAQEKKQVFLGREIAQHRDYSEETAQKIDEEIESLIGDSCDRTRKILNENMDILHKLANILLEKE
ncbi:hypothetical protein LCGC14_1544420, partial [marine sediment metagenome]